MNRYIFTTLIIITGILSLNSQGLPAFYGLNTGIGGNFFPDKYSLNSNKLINWSLDGYYGKQFNDRLSYIGKLELSGNGYKVDINGGWTGGTYSYTGIDNHYSATIYALLRDNLESKTWFLDVGIYYSRMIVRDIYNDLEVNGTIIPEFDPYQYLRYFDDYDFKKNDAGFIVGLGKEIVLNEKLSIPIEISFQKGFLKILDIKQRNLFFFDVGLKWYIK